MDWTLVVVAFVAGLVVGIVAMILINRIKAETWKVYLESEYKGKVSTLEANLSSSIENINNLRLEKTRLEQMKEEEVRELRKKNEELSGKVREVEATLRARDREMEEKVKLLDEAKVKLADTFKALSAEALQTNNQFFLEQASVTLGPVKETLSKFDAKVNELEQKRAEDYGALSANISKMEELNIRLQKETNQLVTALKTPKARGRWGEIQLRNVVEMAGMVKYCDFREQEGVTVDDGRMIPDMLVRLPNERIVIVDSKAPMTAYLEALDTEDEAERIAKLDAHAASVRKHIDALRKKEYWTGFERAPEFVVMFIPGEVFFSAALERDPALIEYGMRNNVIIATPTTLLALLHSVAQGWREAQISRNAEEISRLGRDLYARMSKFVNHLEKLGRSLDKSVENFNNAIGSMNANLLPTARRLKEMEVTADAEIDGPPSIDKRTRNVPMIQDEPLDPE